MQNLRPKKDGNLSNLLEYKRRRCEQLNLDLIGNLSEPCAEDDDDYLRGNTPPLRH